MPILQWLDRETHRRAAEGRLSGRCQKITEKGIQAARALLASTALSVEEFRIIMITDYHSKLFAHELRRRHSVRTPKSWLRLARRPGRSQPSSG